MNFQAPTTKLQSNSKHQAPTSKLQRSSKDQAPKSLDGIRQLVGYSAPSDEVLLQHPQNFQKETCALD
jgi:hypothetical protein